MWKRNLVPGSETKPAEPQTSPSDSDELQTMSEEEVDALLRKVDAESRTRKLSPFWSKAVTVIAILFTSFQLYTAIFGALSPQVQRSIHLSFAMLLGFILYPMRRGKMDSKINPIDLLLIASSIFTSVYWLLYFKDIVYRVGDITAMDFAVGIIAIITVLEATRRVVGYPVLILASISLIYCYLGAFFPSFFQHRGFSLNRIVRHMYLSTEGILGVPIGVVSTFVFLFLLFGAFLKRTGVGQFFNDFANALTGKAVGGPAKVAVISSALQGTISGSSIANVAASGSFTIPLMKKCGYEPEFAAAVEASASTGGQIMPPVMGAAAFLMAEFLGVSYAEVATRAILPAVLYFLGIFIAVHLEAKRSGLKGIPRSELPKFGALIKDIYLLAPIVVLVVMVSTNTKTIQFSAAISIVVAIVASLFKSETRITPRKFMDALAAGARGSITVAVACAVAGIISGCINVTGLGMTLIGTVVRLSGGIPMIGLILTMLCCIVLGMGVPTTANYVIMATTCAPILERLGIDPIAAHFFVFYFGIVADITPPVALAAYAGSAIAKSNPMKTGVQATKLAIGAFIVPYVFALNPSMLFINASVGDIVLICATAVLGMFGIAAAMNGYLFKKIQWYMRIGFMVGGLMLLIPGIVTDIIGLVLVGGLSAYQYVTRGKGDSLPPV